MLTEASWSKDHFAWKTQKRSKFPKMCWKSITHLLCNYLGVLSSSSVCLPFVRFRQNWAFSNQIFWRQTIILLPLSFFHWIGDKPFEAGTAPGSIEQVYQSTIIYNASPSFMRLSTPGQSRKITKIGPKLTGPVWKMTKKPPTPWVSIILWVEIIWFIDLPRPYSGQSGIFIKNLLLFENNLESDWISR